MTRGLVACHPGNLEHMQQRGGYCALAWILREQQVRLEAGGGRGSSACVFTVLRVTRLRGSQHSSDSPFLLTSTLTHTHAPPCPQHLLDEAVLDQAFRFAITTPDALGGSGMSAASKRERWLLTDMHAMQVIVLNAQIWELHNSRRPVDGRARGASEDTMSAGDIPAPEISGDAPGSRSRISAPAQAPPGRNLSLTVALLRLLSRLVRGQSSEPLCCYPKAR